MLIDTAGAIIPEIERDALTSLTKFVDQLPSVLNQVFAIFDPLSQYL